MNSKKELKDAYKRKKFKMGIFRITNKQNGKILIGNSTDLEAIWNRYQMELKFGSHRNKQLQADWDAFGPENFQFEILAEVKQDDKKTTAQLKKELAELEQLYLEELTPFEEKGYNKKPLPK